MTQILPNNTIKIIDIAKYIYDKKINALASFELIKIASNDILSCFIDRDNNFITNQKYDAFVDRLNDLFARYLFNEFKKTQLNDMVYKEIKQIMKDYEKYIKRKNYVNELQKKGERAAALQKGIPQSEIARNEGVSRQLVNAIAKAKTRR